jgi:outer membrane assembly lipoprotein YfiO
MDARPFSFAAGLLLCTALAPADPKTWELKTSGNWAPTTTTTSPASAPVADPTIDRVQQLFDTKQYDAAHDVVLDWLKAHPKGKDRARAIFLMAQVYFVRGDRLESFYQCDELLDNFPDSKLYFPALELQFRVADAYLNGYRNTFLGVAIIPMEETAIEMLFRIQERSPGSPLAERALARSADYYYRSSQFDLAADAYGAFIRFFPRSPLAPRARLRQAYANFAQFRGPRYDATPLLDARAQFLDILARDPEMAREEGVRQFVDRIEEQLAAKIYFDANYYQRVNQPKAAVFLYRTLIQRYPNTREAQVARAAIRKMPPSALTDPPPPQTGMQLPVTRPSMDVK